MKKRVQAAYERGRSGIPHARYKVGSATYLAWRRGRDEYVCEVNLRNMTGGWGKVEAARAALALVEKE